MLFTIPAEPHIFETSPEQEKILNQFLILYADHEQNVASTTVQMIGSTKANLFACVSAGISALWGSREGGQNVAAIELIDEIRGSGLSVKEWFAKHKTREDFTQSTIFGHSAYKVKSPRSVIAKELFHNYFWGKSNAYIDTVREIELYTLQDNYFIEKNLYPNLEFYSAVIFQSLGIPKSMFTVMQALGKLPGWLAHWRELRVTENYKKARPRQIYKGEIGNKYIKIEDRK
jgi:citrate synthase